VFLLFVLEDGDSAEIVVVGNEGIVGISLFVGSPTCSAFGAKALPKLY